LFKRVFANVIEVDVALGIFLQRVSRKYM